MSKKEMHVVPGGGGWKVLSGGKSSAGVYKTQQQAITAARDVAKSRAGELVIHGRDGRIRDKASYADPRQDSSSLRSRKQTSARQGKSARTYVIPSETGWTVVEGNKQGIDYPRKNEAMVAARAALKDRGGELIVYGRDGRIRQVALYGAGGVGRAIKDPPATGRLSRGTIREAVWNGSKGLRRDK